MSKTTLCPFANKKDCFGRYLETLGFGSQCKILNHDAFNVRNLKKWNGECPFYKSLPEFERGVRKFGWLKDENGKKIKYKGWG